MKTFEFASMLHTHKNTDVFITLDENSYDIHSRRANILYVLAGNLAISSNAAKTRSIFKSKHWQHWCVDFLWV